MYKSQKVVKHVKILVHAQDSCACTTLLCMHNTLVHALEGSGTKAGTQKKQPPRAGLAAVFCWVPALVPGPSSACTRMLCMHKSVVHAQKSCACTRILTNKTYQDVPRRPKTYQDVPRRTKTYQDAPRRTRRTMTHQDVPRRTKTYQAVPRQARFKNSFSTQII